jgi:hypothetical protein
MLDSTPDDPFAAREPWPQAYAWLPLGAVRPRGWIERQLRDDLEHGFVGHLDALVPALIRDDDIYGADRLTLAVRRKELGVVAAESAWQVQYLWWNSETQSNWRDGMVRAALLLDHPEFLPRVRGYVDQVLATQDADGYLGIYAPDLRFNLSGENGELWAQASLLRVLLGYYEASGETRVLAAVERAVRRTMAAYPPGQARPFAVERPYAGVGHGLAFADVLDRLGQLTGDDTYAQYALWLYQEYSRSDVGQDDIRYEHLVDPAYLFKGHGVHTYEHLRALLAATYAAGSPALGRALDGYLAKLDRCLAPSGGPIGDEWIAGRAADPTATGYEYCSIHELLDSYTQLLQKTGALRWAGRAEWLLFNAGQGARHPSAGAIAYLKTDNSTSMTGPRQSGEPQPPGRPQTRYKYSPAHQDVAVCCVPNAGRIYPYYVRAMWMRGPAGLAALMYGPCELRTEIDGVAVRISCATSYPLELDLTFTIEVARPLELELAFRVPSWAAGHRCTVAGEPAPPAQGELIAIRRIWRGGELVRLSFAARVEIDALPSGELALRRGPLLYARPIAAEERLGRAYPLPGFVDRYYEPVPGEPAPYILDPGDLARFELEPGAPDPASPWQTAPALAGPMRHPHTGQIERVRLLPIGATILRQATFPRV